MIILRPFIVIPHPKRLRELLGEEGEFPVVGAQDFDGFKTELVSGAGFESDGVDGADIGLARAIDAVMINAIRGQRDFVKVETFAVSFGGENLNGDPSVGTGIAERASRQLQIVQFWKKI